MSTTQDYCRKAARYIERVLSGKIPACRFVRLACERQQADLARAKGGRWKFIFDKERCLCSDPPVFGPAVSLCQWSVFNYTCGMSMLPSSFLGRRKSPKPSLNGFSLISISITPLKTENQITTAALTTDPSSDRIAQRKTE